MTIVCFLLRIVDNSFTGIIRGEDNIIQPFLLPEGIPNEIRGGMTIEDNRG